LDRRVPVRDAVEMLDLPVTALDIATVSRLVKEQVAEAEVEECAWMERTFPPAQVAAYYQRKARRDESLRATVERIRAEKAKKRQRRSRPSSGV
jgi:hypothetical protein